MKKIIFSFIIVLITVYSVNAQKGDSNVGFNVGAELGIATGNLNLAYSIAYGATAQIEYSINDKTNITANSGIIQYVGKKISGTTFKNRSNAVIPVLVGAKYYLSDNFFGSAQLGMSIFTGAVSVTKFTYVPALGFKINEKIEAMVKYTGYSEIGGAFGIRVAYSL